MFSHISFTDPSTHKLNHQPTFVIKTVYTLGRLFPTVLGPLANFHISTVVPCRRTLAHLNRLELLFLSPPANCQCHKKEEGTVNIISYAAFVCVTG